MKIDFFGKESHYIDHLAPVYNALGENAGDFFVPSNLEEYLKEKNIEPKKVDLKGNNPIVVSSHQDIQSAYMSNSKRPIIMMEHGAVNFFPGNPSYVGNHGYRTKASLTLSPNQMMFEQTLKALPQMKQAIIGTPKLDPWMEVFNEKRTLPQKPTICISFHWDGKHVAPEAGTAFEYYKNTVLELGRNIGFVWWHMHIPGENQ